MYPCLAVGHQALCLYTYYAFMSLLVVGLVVSLIWIPFKLLITEINTIIVRMVIYFNVEIFGCNNTKFLNDFESIMLSQCTILVMTACCIAYTFYLASGNILIFAGCYICSLPDTIRLRKLKTMALEIIDYLLHLTGKKQIFTKRTKCIGI